MKLKARTEDFIVEEILTFQTIHKKRDFAVYRIVKRNTNTLDVLADIAKRLHISRRTVSYGGLKDKHSLAIQYVSIKGGKPFQYVAKNYSFEFIGYSDIPVDKASLLGNRFTVTAREISSIEKNRIEQNLQMIKKQGFINYFDEQRISSARHGKGYVAQKIIRKEFALAVRLLFEVSSHDNSQIRKFRKYVSDNWGKWEKCIECAPSNWEKEVLKHLATNRSGWRHALEFVDKDLLFLLGTAYQSFLWNKAASEFLADIVPVELLKELPFKQGERIFVLKKLDSSLLQKLRVIEIPLPSPSLRLNEHIGDIYDRILRAEGIDGMQAMRSRIGGMVFKSNRRQILIMPKNLLWRWESEHSDNRTSLNVSVSLPKGSYVTMLLRQSRV